MSQSTHCPFPWNHLFVDVVGNFWTCCIGPYSKELVKDAEGNLIFAHEKNSILRHWHSPQMTEIRRALSAGEKTPACVACWDPEKRGEPSYRQGANEEWTIDENKKSELFPEPRFDFVDLRFGNFCNLSCRMCGPVSSSRLIEEYEELEGAGKYSFFKRLNWFESPHFWEELAKYSEHIKKIHVAGGEPLIIKECWKFLRSLVESGASQKLLLSYNTNMSVFPREIEEVWPKFKGVNLDLSLDGVGEMNEFIRHPLKWSTLDANIRKLDDNFERLKLSRVQIHATVQVYNLMRIDEICDYAATFTSIGRIPRFTIVTDPPQFSIAVLPDAYKEKAAEKIKSYIFELKLGRNRLNRHDRETLIQYLVGILHFLKHENQQNLWEKFLRHNNIYDKKRGQSVIQSIPELAEII